ncbi:MAG: universal stress protein [Acidimicrobiia bacterium]
MTTIVVGVSDTETAARAFDRAGELAHALGATLYVVSAYDHDSVEVIGAGSDTFTVSTSRQVESFVEATVARARSRWDIEATGRAVAGKPEQAILEVARDVDASVIVVGNVRMQGPGRVLGSVANHIAHHAPCDVYVVKTV